MYRQTEGSRTEIRMNRETNDKIKNKENRKMKHKTADKSAAKAIRAKNLAIRTLFYLMGFLIMTMGIAVSIKSDMGVSPVSSIPYTMTCIWGIEMGKTTILFNIALVFVQIPILRKRFKPVNLLQIPVCVIFGIFTTFSNRLMVYFPDPQNVTVQVILMLASISLIAFGIFMYVPANFVPLAGEGVTLAISKVTKIKFSTCKLIFDISMVTISLTTCLIVLHRLGSVGIGTIASAVLVGAELKFFIKILGNTRDRILKPDVKENSEAESGSTASAISPLLCIMKKDVYTISKDASLLDALKLFKEKKVSGVPVVDESGKLAGFISAGDIIRNLCSEHSLFVDSYSLEKIEFNEALLNTISKPVSSIAAKKVLTVDADDDLSEVCYKLGENKLKKAPVMQGGEMIGIINVSNIIKYAVDMIENPNI